MDRFLEEQEGVRDRSSSPNVNSLMHTDNKRQKINLNAIENEESATSIGNKQNLENWDMSGANATTGKTDWDVKAVIPAVTTATTNPIKNDNETTNLVNSGSTEPVIHNNHHHNLSNSTIISPTAVNQIVCAKTNSSNINNSGIANESTCTSSITNTNTIITTVLSSSSSSEALIQQEQLNNNHVVDVSRQEQVTNLNVNKNNESDSVLRTSENSLPEQLL